MALLEKAEKIESLVEALVYAKQHGLIDFVEARDLLSKALEEAPYQLRSRTGGRQGNN